MNYGMPPSDKQVWGCQLATETNTFYYVPYMFSLVCFLEIKRLSRICSPVDLQNHSWKKSELERAYKDD